MKKEVTVEDLAGLKKQVDWNIASLTVLRDSIGKAIYHLSIPFEEEREFQLYDKVKIISTDDYELIDYVGQEGFIVKIDLDWEYPYDVEFLDKKFSNEWLWKAEELKLV